MFAQSITNNITKFPFLMKNFLLAFLLHFALTSHSQTVTLTQSAGWMECAYVKWNPVPGADSYNVYYSGGSLINVPIDTQLIRNYGTYYRADVLGLAAGNYTIKVAPVTAGIEGVATVSDPITVTTHDKSGFAHEGGHVPGAYNLDGTLKSNAVVIYVTPNSKNTVSLNVIGANTNPCVGLQNILDGYKRGQDSRPLCVRFIGKITDFNYLLNGDIVVENNNLSTGSITLEGVGSDAVAYGWGIRIKNASNIELKNLGFMLTDASEGDNVGIQQNNDHIWVHNCDMFYGAAGSAADQAKGDGALDCKKSTYVTHSYNHFWDNGKCNLLGLSENTTTGLYATYHHNWYDHSDSRHPRVRFYSAHVYNNYFDGNSKYGVGSTMGSSVFVEGNYFRNCKYPMLTSLQGTDIYNGSVGTFSGEDGGTIKAFNNTMIGQTRYVAYDPINFPVQFDAYQASTRTENIPGTITSLQGNNTYNNFDTDPSLYIASLVVDDPIVAKNNVIQHSGRVAGGDFTWAFTNSTDDSSYAVNEPLLAALTGYTSTLVSIQGDPVVAESTHTLAIPNNNEQMVNSGEAISPMVFTWGGEATTVSVTGLPSSGISYTLDNTANTITISGIPTANVTFSITTVGVTGTPVSGSGTISIFGLPASDQIHNFTLSALNSTFYTFASANLNSTAGLTTYDGLTLTTRLKMESGTNISYTTNAASTLTLVFDPTFSGTVKLDGVSYSATAGIVIIPSVPAGTHSITKGTIANLFYIKTAFNTLGTLTPNQPLNSLVLHPNPANEVVMISTDKTIDKIAVYTLTGQLVKEVIGNQKTIDISALAAGNYLVKVVTANQVLASRLIKN
jgi:pectate lyase